MTGINLCQHGIVSDYIVNVSDIATITSLGSNVPLRSIEEVNYDVYPSNNFMLSIVILC